MVKHGQVYFQFPLHNLDDRPRKTDIAYYCTSHASNRLVKALTRMTKHLKPLWLFPDLAFRMP